MRRTVDSALADASASVPEANSSLGTTSHVIATATLYGSGADLRWGP
jgi:hypothetical protein